jgi:hypothetical protein
MIDFLIMNQSQNSLPKFAGEIVAMKETTKVLKLSQRP